MLSAAKNLSIGESVEEAVETAQKAPIGSSSKRLGSRPLGVDVDGELFGKTSLANKKFGLFWGRSTRSEVSLRHDFGWRRLASSHSATLFSRKFMGVKTTSGAKRILSIHNTSHSRTASWKTEPSRCVPLVRTCVSLVSGQPGTPRRSRTGTNGQPATSRRSRTGTNGHPATRRRSRESVRPGGATRTNWSGTRTAAADGARISGSSSLSRDSRTAASWPRVPARRERLCGHMGEDPAEARVGLVYTVFVLCG